MDVVGYSFGCTVLATLVGSAPPWVVRRGVVVAPAGVVPAAGVDEGVKGVMEGRVNGREAEVVVRGWLGGGEVDRVVTEEERGEWKKRRESGEVVVETLRLWLGEEHGGWGKSLVGFVRDGGVVGMEGVFGEVARVMEGRMRVVLAGEDWVTSEEAMRGMGFKDVKVVEGAGHSFVREREWVGMVGRLVTDFLGENK